MALPPKSRRHSDARTKSAQPAELVEALAKALRPAGRRPRRWPADPGDAAADAVYVRLGAYREPLVAHAVFDDGFSAVAAEGWARCGSRGG